VALLRYQFTLRQLIKVVVLAALFFAMFRTPAWPFILAIGLVLPGFAIDRGRGGSGILGAILSGMLGFVGMGTAFYVTEWVLLHRQSNDLPAPFPFLAVLGLMGLAWGLLVGVWAGLVVSIVRRIRPEPLDEASLGPISWRRLDSSKETIY
jgi:hypothetical protein